MSDNLTIESIDRETENFSPFFYLIAFIVNMIIFLKVFNYVYQNVNDIDIMSKLI